MKKIIACGCSKLYVSLVASAIILLTGCGQSGPLYLPSTTSGQSSLRIASPPQTPNQNYSQPDNQVETETQRQSQPNPQPPTKPMAAT